MADDFNDVRLRDLISLIPYDTEIVINDDSDAIFMGLVDAYTKNVHMREYDDRITDRIMPMLDKKLFINLQIED